LRHQWPALAELYSDYDLISQSALHRLNIDDEFESLTMFAARQVTRNAPRFAAQLRTPMQRRFASTAENEFVTERQHIKEHAQGSTGECSKSWLAQLRFGSAFNHTSRALEEDFSLVCPLPIFDRANFYVAFDA
jgi:hypothetical protein